MDNTVWQSFRYEFMAMVGGGIIGFWLLSPPSHRNVHWFFLARSVLTIKSQNRYVSILLADNGTLGQRLACRQYTRRCHDLLSWTSNKWACKSALLMDRKSLPGLPSCLRYSTCPKAASPKRFAGGDLLMSSHLSMAVANGTVPQATGQARHQGSTQHCCLFLDKGGRARLHHPSWSHKDPSPWRMRASSAYGDSSHLVSWGASWRQ